MAEQKYKVKKGQVVRLLDRAASFANARYVEVTKNNRNGSLFVNTVLDGENGNTFIFCGEWRPINKKERGNG